MEGTYRGTEPIEVQFAISTIVSAHIKSPELGCLLRGVKKRSSKFMNETQKCLVS